MPSLSLSSSPSAVAAAIRVHKATSEVLVGPDWTMNMEICDFCNNSQWLAKDVVKEVRRRLHHKNPKVQLLTLTLLETMVKNCGDYIHQHIANRKILDEMIKTVKKKPDIHVRDKMLLLLDSWQEAFGGPGEKYSQYYWACDELRRHGITFPERSQRSAPIITPPANNPPRIAQVGFSMPPTSSKRLDDATSLEAECLSASILESMRTVVELLDDMLEAVNPSDRTAVREEVIADLVDRCRSNQRKLMQMLTTATDEELLPQGLELNYSLQSVLAKHDAIALGAPLPNLKKNLRSCEAKDKSTVSNANCSTSDALVARNLSEEEEPEDEFPLLSRRHSKTSSVPLESATMGATEEGASSSGSTCNALVLIDAPAPTPAPATSCNTKEQDLIDLLSIVLTSSSTSSETTQPADSAPIETNFEASFDSYVAPWAQPQSQQPAHSQHHFQSQYQNVQALLQPPPQQGYSNYSSYSHSTWEATAYNNYQNVGSNLYGYATSPGPMNSSSIPVQGNWPFQNPQCRNQHNYPATQVTVCSASPMHGVQSFQHFNSFHTPPALNQASAPLQGIPSLEHVNYFPARASNGTSLNGNALVTTGSSLIPGGEKPYVPSYRLFEDLNVFGSSEGKFNSEPHTSASGFGQNVFAGRR